MSQAELEWFDASIQTRQALVWRGVESQYAVATMRLVDSLAEQELLEQLLEGSKPPIHKDWHYLLFTPFRYTPPHAHRFRPAHARGQWYGAVNPVAVCAEIAYWRYRFILDSATLVATELLTEHTLFQAIVQGPSMDLMQAPWLQKRDLWTHGSDYTATQALAAEAVRRGVQWLSYESVRAPGEVCAVAFDPDALSEPPQGIDATRQSWHCKTTRSKVMLMGNAGRFEWSF
ncbi:MAG: RES family NAD+ phosphorylase [Burkholderiaceae bacterium]|nr:RES family NAD+ phosphorylase [Burkholderiaceae bacterium]